MVKSIFDCEGYVGKDHIKIQSVNKTGMKQVNKLLKEFDIKANSYQYYPKNPNWNTNHILTINKKSDRLKYYNYVGFNHFLKYKKLKETLKIYK
jgi:intein/homing endonuclease